MACGLFTGSYEIFIIVVYGIFGAACGIVTAACGIFSCGMLDLFNCHRLDLVNCHRQDLYCGMESFKLWYDLFCSMRDLFLFGSMWDLELQHADLINCRMYDLCCSMQDLFISGMWEVLVVA